MSELPDASALENRRLAEKDLYDALRWKILPGRSDIGSIGWLQLTDVIRFYIWNILKYGGDPDAVRARANKDLADALALRDAAVDHLFDFPRPKS